MDKKQAIINQLKNTYCRLKPSPLHGIGVFAVRDIPRGINPLMIIKEPLWTKFSFEDLKDIDREVLTMVSEYCTFEKDGTIFIPDSVLNGMDISFYVNDSETPNLVTRDDGLTFTTKRKIKKGEELCVSYKTYDDNFRD